MYRNRLKIRVPLQCSFSLSVNKNNVLQETKLPTTKFWFATQLKIQLIIYTLYLLKRSISVHSSFPLDIDRKVQ